MKESLWPREGLACMSEMSSLNEQRVRLRRRHANSLHRYCSVYPDCKHFVTYIIQNRDPPQLRATQSLSNKLNISTGTQEGVGFWV